MSNEPIKTKNELVEEAISKLTSDDEKIKAILAADSSEEMKEVFKSVGLDITDEQIEIFKKTFVDSMNAEINKLPAEERKKLMQKASETDLENTSGGSKSEPTQKELLCGMVFGPIVGSFASSFNDININDIEGENNRCGDVNVVGIRRNNALGDKKMVTLAGSAIGTAIGAATGLR